MTTSLHTRPSKSAFIGQHLVDIAAQTRNARTATATHQHHKQDVLSNENSRAAFSPIAAAHRRHRCHSLCPKSSEACGAHGTMPEDGISQIDVLEVDRFDHVIANRSQWNNVVEHRQTGIPS